MFPVVLTSKMYFSSVLCSFLAFTKNAKILVIVCVCVWLEDFFLLYLYLHMPKDLYLFIPGRLAEPVFTFIPPSILQGLYSVFPDTCPYLRG